MDDKLKERVLNAYQAPFKYHLGRILDKSGDIFCDGVMEIEGEIIADALNQYWEFHKKGV